MIEEPAGDLLIRAEQACAGAAGDPDRWRDPAEELIAQARAAGHPEALVVALRASAQAHRNLLGHDRAAHLLAEAARVATRHHLDVRLGEVLIARGVVRHELGQVGAARRDFDRAARLVGPDLAAELAMQRAALAHNTGRLGDAAQLYAQVLGTPGSGPDVRTRAANNLAIIQAQRGDFTGAQARLQAAADSAAQVGPAYVAIVAETRAWVVVQSGRLREGLALFAQAEGLWSAAGFPLGELYAEYADALVDLRLVPEALEQARRAAAMLEGQGVHLMAAEAQLRVARLAVLIGSADDAVRLAGAAAAQMRRQHRPDWAARAELVAVEARLAAGRAGPGDHAVARRAARTLERAGMPALAVEGYLRAGRAAAAGGRPRAAVADWAGAQRLSRGAPVLVRLKGQLGRALAAQAQQRPEEVLRACRRGLADLARHRAALASTELRALASGHGAELGALGLGALLRGGTPAQVLEWMERTRAAALAAVEAGAPEDLDEEMGALRALQAEIVQSRQDSGREPPELLARQAEIEARIRRHSWTAAAADGAGATAEVASTAGLRSALDGRVLVEYDELDGHLLAAVVEPRRTRLVRLGPVAAVDAEVEGLRFALRSLARGGPASGALRDIAAATVGRLAALLVEPLRLPPDAAVLVVPVGELQRVPWSALLDRPVSVAPSAALWRRSQAVPAPERPAAAGPFSAGSPPAATAGGGGVVLVAGPDLEGAAAEVAALHELHRGATVLVPPHSRAEAVRAALSGAALAHLACHGTVRSDNPTFSSILVADGPLTVHEFDRRAAAPYRLVLAACDVGSSATYPGNEALGFVGTLLARGTGGLLASTVLVPDAHVTALMTAVHARLLRGATIAEALHAARVAIGEEDPASYPAWCAFTAYGAA